MQLESFFDGPISLNVTCWDFTVYNFVGNGNIFLSCCFAVQNEDHKKENYFRPVNFLVWAFSMTVDCDGGTSSCVETSNMVVTGKVVTETSDLDRWPPKHLKPPEHCIWLTILGFDQIHFQSRWICMLWTGARFWLSKLKCVLFFCCLLIFL